MSDYIYGSSLRAAKSKANYLFEGDFRRRPNQNLSGASRSLPRGELLQQAAEQRQNREDSRRKEQASIKIQSVWRGLRSRRLLAREMRNSFDHVFKNLTTNQHNLTQKSNELSSLIRSFVISYDNREDEHYFNQLVDFLMMERELLNQSIAKDPRIWLHRVIELLKIDLGLLRKYGPSLDIYRYIKFLQCYTEPNLFPDQQGASSVWQSLIDHNIYTIMREIVSITQCSSNNRDVNCDLETVIIEIIERSLNTELKRQVRVFPTRPFFDEFLRGPLSPTINSIYLPKLLELQPKGLTPERILSDFNVTDRNSSKYTRTEEQSPNDQYNSTNECSDGIWLCYSFVKTIHWHIEKSKDFDKSKYITILADLLGPAEYITNISLMQAANNETDSDQNSNETDDIDPTSRVDQINQYYTELNRLITQVINMINDSSHISSLKAIILHDDISYKVQSAVIRVCNLMLAHEPFAIFNCRLLYTVAFSRKFSRSLWNSIVMAKNPSLYGTSTPIYMELSKGLNITRESWDMFLPQLRLFCSLHSYLLPTLDDMEFYPGEDKTTSDHTHQQVDLSQTSLSSDANKNISATSFFFDKELINISSILRDICVGFIEILYKDTRNAYGHGPRQLQILHQDESSRLMSFKTKLCFKALVRLVCQLHARDSRKRFCPDGHWICPSVMIPANKAIDFQLLTSQQGRLLSNMTKDDKNNEMTPTTPSEIKAVLILQEIPFVTPFQDRVQIFHHLLHKERQMHHSEGYHFGLPGTAIMIKVRRNYIYEDAFEKLSIDNELNMKLPLRVSMINAVGAAEAGIDGGGLTKEFLSELLKAGFDPMRGFFKYTTDNLLYPNPSANVLFSNLPEGYEIHYEFLGRMLGKAIFEKIMVELPLASFFLAKILARKHSSDVDLHNLASLDPVLYKNLVYLKNYRGDVADLNLDFSISNNELDEHEVVELKQNGSKIPVTRENRIEYVHLVADYRLNKQIRAQCAAFKRGLSQMIDLDWLRMFDSRELQILISGAPTLIDTSDWRRHTVYSNGYTNECEPINIFWRVVDSFDEKDKRRLLKFATSCSLPPLLGFKDLVPQFCIAPSEGSRLPTASTCMNLLKLPQCEDEVTMRSKLLYAIESNSGFELS